MHPILWFALGVITQQFISITVKQIIKYYKNKKENKK